MAAEQQDEESWLHEEERKMSHPNRRMSDDRGAIPIEGPASCHWECSGGVPEKCFLDCSKPRGRKQEHDTPTAESMNLGAEAFDFVSVRPRTFSMPLQTRNSIRRPSLFDSGPLHVDVLSSLEGKQTEALDAAVGSSTRDVEVQLPPQRQRLPEVQGGASAHYGGVVATAEPEPLVKPSQQRKEPSLADRFANHWFFKNPDSSAAEEEQAPRPAGAVYAEVEGIGEGQLTAKVINALGLQAKAVGRQESRKMNMWMPQGM